MSFPKKMGRNLRGRRTVTRSKTDIISDTVEGLSSRGPRSIIDLIILIRVTVKNGRQSD